MSSMETFNNAVLRQLPPPTKLAGCPTTRFVTSLSELCASRRKVHPCTIEQTYHHHHHHRHQRKRITRVTSLLRSHVSAKLVYLCNLPVIGGFRYFSIRTSRWSCIFFSFSFSFSSFSRARRRSSFSRGLRIVSPCLPRERQRERERERESSPPRLGPVQFGKCCRRVGETRQRLVAKRPSLPGGKFQRGVNVNFFGDARQRKRD